MYLIIIFNFLIVKIKSMYLLNMNVHISNKNLHREKYFDQSHNYIQRNSVKFTRYKITKKRYNYYNLWFEYMVYEIGKTRVISKDLDNTSIIDLSSPSLFIKGTSILDNDSSITKFSPPEISFINPNMTSNGSQTDTFNVLDLLLPEYSHSALTKASEQSSPEKSSPEKREFRFTEEELGYDYHIIKDSIENISDLIKLGKKYEDVFKPMKKQFNLNIRVLSKMVPHLEDLNKMIGMDNIKTAIFEKIILFLQGLDDNPNDFHHIVLYGGPGMGKTVVAKIIGQIYAKMGLLSKGDFKEISLTDLKGGYIGQSEIKTQKILDESKGCVVFLDEAYSLGSEDKIDSYSQGIIDLINPYLDKHRDDFIFIIAGYKTDLETRFFRGNQGLKSRFGLWLEIEKYEAGHLRDIFIKKIEDNKWNTSKDSIPIDFFNKEKEVFKYFGRDIENLFSKCKIAHAKRVLFGKKNDKKNITTEDLLAGYELYKLHMYDNKVDKNVSLEFMYT